MEQLKLLVMRARSGDLEAFAKIVRRFQDMAYGSAYAILGDFHLAEDAAQEAFIEAYRQLGNLRLPEAFPGWFRRVVFKHCDRIARRRRAQTACLDVAARTVTNEAGPPQVAEAREMREKVLEAVRALPEHQRLVTTLFYINGYSQRDVAEFLEVPVTTVKKRLHDSRKRLKEGMIHMVDETLKSFPLPDSFGDLVVRRAASEEDLKKAAGMLTYARKRLPEHFRSPADAEKAGIYVVGEEGSVGGAGYFNEIDWSIGATVLRGVRPGEMGAEGEGVPDPAFVRSFQACFQLAQERGVHLAAVHGSQYDHAFCGFVPCFYHPVATVPVERLKSVTTGATVREVRDEEERQEGWEAFLRDPYAVKIGGGAPTRISHVVEHDGAAAGYVGWGGWNSTSLTLRTRDAALALLKFMAEREDNEEITVVESHLTPIVQTMLSLGGKYLLRPSCDVVALDNEMVAIIDLAGLTQALAGEFASRLGASPVHQVDGSFSIEMSGTTVGFIVGSGRVEIVTEEQKVHRALSRWVVTRLYQGYYSGEDLLTMGPIPDDRSDGQTPDHPDRDMKRLALPENEAALFKALFPKLWPCSSPDPDVWPWVLGQEYPLYRLGDKEPPERRAQIDALKLPWIGY